MSTGRMEVSKEFDGYVLRRLIGKGGMGEVYLAQDTLLDRPVAVKFISSGEITTTLRDRFLTEARAIARLQHPNVVAIYRVGEVDDKPYIIYEFVRGKALDTLPRPISPELALKVGLDIASGLAAANRRGVLHRDIKPGNAILSDDGDIKLLDFGLAKMMDPSSQPRSDAEGLEAKPTRALKPVKAEDPAPTMPQMIHRKSPRPSPEHVKTTEKKEFNAFSETMAPAALRNAGRAASSGLEQTLDPGPRLGLVPGASSRGQAAVASSPDLDQTIDGVLDADVELAGLNDLDQTMDAPAGVLPPPKRVAAPSRDPAASKLNSGTWGRSAPSATPEWGPMGTPDYMAPEVWEGEPATVRSDVYSFGAMLYALCSGRPPHRAKTLSELRRLACEQRPRPLAPLAPEQSPELCQVVDRCLERDPMERFASAEELHLALARLLPEARATVVPEGNPYRGLQTFEAQHRNLFFGRDSDIRVLLERLNVESFLLVAGDSGVGKSSFCRAGLLSRVPHWFRDKRKWKTITLVPGRYPLQALAFALAPLLKRDPDRLEQEMLDDPGGMARRIRTWPGEKRGLVVFIDQLEELATIADAEQAEALTQVLGWLTEPTPGLRLLATARSDFLGRLATLPRLGDQLSRAIFFLRNLDQEGIREAITGPAAAKGVAFESDELVNELVQSTLGAGRGGLPLLQFALAELWQARKEGSGSISRAELEAIGGVAGALNRHADNVLSGMLPAGREVAPQVLTRLVSAEGTRVYRSGEELGGGPEQPAVQEALAALVRGRLVVARDRPDGSAGYEIAHEALVSSWSTLADWLSNSAEARRVQENLQRSMDEWQRLGRAREVLWSPRQLAEARHLDPDQLSDQGREFLAASRRALLRRKLLRGGLLVLILAIAVTVYAVVQYQNRAEVAARVGAKLAEARQALHKAHALKALTDKLHVRAMERFDRQDVPGGEVLWSSYQTKVADLPALYRTAGQILEAALLMDPQRSDVRELIADVLLQRALVAERRHDQEQLEGLLQRLALYDQGEKRRKQWSRPARLWLAVQPTDAMISVGRYEKDAQGRLRQRPVQSSPGSLKQVALPPGSYLLVITAPGYAPVRFPVLLRRGEQVKHAVGLPRQALVPRGFVYVPPGDFLFGSAAKDEQRKGFHHHIPIHRVRTKGYMIALTEVTFAQFLEYLKALPADQRKARAPAVGKGGFEGSLSLAELDDGAWQLVFKPKSQSFSARAGAKIRYTARRLRQSQDWLNLPVVGVSYSDALAYVNWLATSGRLPTARLCAEHEWERGARGADGREYPHGHALLATDANFDMTYGKVPAAMGPDEVGSFPASASPLGLLDMSGNVWEWTRSSVEPGKFPARGGSWYFSANSARATERQLPEASFKDVSVGLRVCADAPPGFQ